MVAVVLHVAAALAVTWTTNYVMLTSLMFVMGVSVAGILLSSFVLSKSQNILLFKFECHACIDY